VVPQRWFEPGAFCMQIRSFNVWVNRVACRFWTNKKLFFLKVWIHQPSPYQSIVSGYIGREYNECCSYCHMENKSGNVRKLLMIQLTMTRYMMVLYTFLILSINTGRVESVSLAELRVRIPPGACLSLFCVVCCPVEVPALDWSFVQMSPTECGVSWAWPWSLNHEEVLTH
jgi:hypothetical protein